MLLTDGPSPVPVAPRAQDFGTLPGTNLPRLLDMGQVRGGLRSRRSPALLLPLLHTSRAAGISAVHRITLTHLRPLLAAPPQCNDAYSALVVATELAKVFKTDVNSLPLSLDLSWFEQKVRRRWTASPQATRCLLRSS
jgi:hypothetical protein